MEIKKLVKENVLKNSYIMQSINLHKKDYQGKKGIGIIQYYEYKKGDILLIVRTGLKKDIKLTNKNSGIIKQWLLRAIKNKEILYYVNAKEIDNDKGGSNYYGIIYLLRDGEIQKINNASKFLGIWSKGEKEWFLEKKMVIECNFLYSKKKGRFFLGINNQQYFLPKGQRFIYYSRKMNIKKYVKLVKILKILMNILINKVKKITLIDLIKLTDKEQEKLIKKLKVINWLLEKKGKNILLILDKISWKWRINYIFIYKYIIELNKNILKIEKVIKIIKNLKLKKIEKKIIAYQLKEKQISSYKETRLGGYIEEWIKIIKKKEDLEIEKKYFISKINDIYKEKLRKEINKKEEKLMINVGENKYKLHLVALIKHHFKKNVVSRRTLEPMHKKLAKETKINRIMGKVINNDKNKNIWLNNKEKKFIKNNKQIMMMKKR